MDDSVPLEQNASFFLPVVISSSSDRSESNSSVPWCRTRPPAIFCALPEIFLPSTAISQVRFFCAGTPSAFSARMTGSRQRS